MDQAPYSIADDDDDGHLWHIPGPTDAVALCGMDIAIPLRRYLPVTLGPADIVCAKCLALYQADQGKARK